MEARAEVKRVFNLLSTDHDELIPRENILRFLDQQGHELYDRSVFEQLYHRTQKGKHGYITINDFIQAMFDGLDSLKNKVYKVQDSLFEKQKQLTDLNAKYQQVLKTERYNDYDISTQSMIQVTIADALLNFEGSANVYFELGCFKQKQQSQKIPKSNPIWDECFEFNVQTGKEQLWMIILDEATPANEVIGQVNLDVMQFYDQLKHRLTLDFKDRANMIVTARVNVIIQWIHSQSKYFESLITIAQHEVQQYQFDIDEFKKDIKALFNPFNQLQQMHAYMSSQFAQRDKVTAYGQPQKLEVHYSKYYETEDFMKVSIFGTLLYLIGVLLASLDKTCFFDLLVLSYILLFFRNNARLASLLHIKIILVMLAVAIIYDVIWLYFYTRPWTTAKTVYQAEDTLEQYEVILTFILIFLKLLLMAINFWIYKLNPDKSPDVFDAQYRLLFKEEKPENQLIVPVTQVMQSQYVLQPPLRPTTNKFPAF